MTAEGFALHPEWQSGTGRLADRGEPVLVAGRDAAVRPGQQLHRADGMTTAMPLDVPAAAGPAIANEVRRYGALDVETGGFLLAPEGTGSVCTVAFAGTSGIIRRRLQLQISEIALDQLFGFAEEQGCWVPAQFHSHAGESVPVADRPRARPASPRVHLRRHPRFRRPARRSPDAWTWWRFGRAEWHPADSPSSVEAAICGRSSSTRTASVTGEHSRALAPGAAGHRPAAGPAGTDAGGKPRRGQPRPGHAQRHADRARCC